MRNFDLVPTDIQSIYEVHEWRNATAILSQIYSEEWQDVLEVLRDFRLLKTDVLSAGGGKSIITKKIDGALYGRGWVEKEFDIKIVVDERIAHAPTHHVDCVKSKVGLELEWNNKDTFYDRDLNNFRLLFDLRVIDVGIIVTRSSELQSLFNELGKGTSYGASTTHMSKLIPKIEGGGGGGCPIIAFGITKELYISA